MVRSRLVTRSPREHRRPSWMPTGGSADHHGHDSVRHHITATGADGAGSTIINLAVGRAPSSIIRRRWRLSRTWLPRSHPPVPTSHPTPHLRVFPRASVSTPPRSHLRNAPSTGTLRFHITATGPVAPVSRSPSASMSFLAPSITYAGSPCSATEGLEFSASPTSTEEPRRAHPHRRRPSRWHVLNPTTVRSSCNLDIIGQVRNFTITASNASGTSPRSPDNDGGVIVWVWHSISTLSTSPVWSGLGCSQRRGRSSGLR